MFIDGQNLYALNEERRTLFRRRQIGFVFQSFHLIAELTVEQNIQFPLAARRLAGPRFRPSSTPCLRPSALADRRAHLPSQLSGGQQQRVAIGRALITPPRASGFCVWPTSRPANLDRRNSREVMELLTRAARQ